MEAKATISPIPSTSILAPPSGKTDAGRKKSGKRNKIISVARKLILWELIMILNYIGPIGPMCLISLMGLILPKIRSRNHYFFLKNCIYDKLK
jgi:hypothetical protein